MNSKQTDADHRALRFAGFMGHDFALIRVGKDGKPHIVCEAPTAESAKVEAKPGDRLYRKHNNARNRRRAGCRFRKVWTCPETQANQEN